MIDSERNFIEAYRELGELKVVPYLQEDFRRSDYGVNSLAILVGNFLNVLDDSLVDYYHEGKIDPERKKPVLFLKGLPKSGKTWARKKVEEVLLHFSGTGQLLNSGGIRIRTWEEAEASARESGEIKTLKGQPLTDQELRASHRHFDLVIYSDLADEGVLGEIIEAPVFTSAFVQGRYVGRELGGRVARKLALKLPPYNNIPIELFSAAMMAGPRLRYVETFYQAEMKVAPTYKKACEVSRRFGKNPPTVEEWEIDKQEGASLIELSKVESAAEDLLNRMEADKVLVIPPQEVFQFAYNQEIGQLLDPDEIYGAHRAWAMGFVMRQVLQLEMRVPSERAVVCFNDPTFRELNIQNPEVLIEYFVKRKKEWGISL